MNNVYNLPTPDTIKEAIRGLMARAVSEHIASLKDDAVLSMLKAPLKEFAQIEEAQAA